MSNISTYLADALLGHYLGVAAYTAPTPYVALFTTMPTMPAGTGAVEVSTTSTGYARVALGTDMGAPASGSCANTASITFPTATASWGTVVGVGIYDAATAGNLLEAITLSASQTVASGGQIIFTAGNFSSALS